MSNPFLKDRKITIAYYPIWFAIFIIQVTLLIYFLHIKFVPALLDSFIYNGLYVFIGIGIWFTVRFNSLESYTTGKIFLNHTAGAVLTSVVWVFAGYLSLKTFQSDDKIYQTFLTMSLIWRFLIGILLYVVFVAVYYVIIYYHNFQEKVLKESELNALVKEAELKSLKYQINPHFIFNSLNSISSLTISNPQKAQEMTIKLSAFLRATLSKNEKQKSKLVDELANAKLYLEIEKVRFDEKFEFVENISEDCADMEIPNMILQPLFENAIKHGVYESLSKVVIDLKCKISGDYFLITVQNDFDPESIPRKGEGIGLKNIKNRLKLIYNQDNLVTIEKINNKFSVNIYIPLVKNAK